MGTPRDGTPAFVRLAAHPLRWRLLTELALTDLRVRELAARVEEPQNLVSYHLRLLRNGGLVAASRSSFDGRDSYYRLDLVRCARALADAGAALHPALAGFAGPRAMPGDRPSSAGPRAATPAGDPVPRASVLFVCTGNSARSPIAEALLRRHTRGAVAVTSAGTRPKPVVDPGAVRLMRDQYGIDLTDHRPRHVETLTAHRFDHVITLCDKARETCPDVDGSPRRAHWSIPEPAADNGRVDSGTTLERVTTDIDTRVQHLLAALTDRPEAPP